MTPLRRLHPWLGVAKSLVLPLAGVLAGLGAAAAVTSVMEPTYRATASVIVTPATKKKSGTQPTDVTLALNLALSVARLAESREVAEAVAEKLRLSPDDVFSQVTATTEPGNQIVTIQAEGGTARRAAAVANEATSTTARLYGKLRLGGRTAVLVRPLDRAPASGRPVAPRPMLNYALGGLVGLLVGIGFGSLRRRTDDRFRRVADVEAELGLPAVGVLRATPRWFTGNAARSYRSRPMADCLNSVMAAISVLGGSRAGRRVVVTGVGDDRETILLASVFAVALSSRGESTILSDGQPRRPGLTRHFRSRPAQSVAEAFSDRNASGPTSGLTVLGAAAVEDYVNRSGEQVGSLLDALAELADHVVLVAPPVLAGPGLAQVTDHADVVLLVVASDHASRAEAARAGMLVRRLEVATVATVVTGMAADEDGWQSEAWAATPFEAAGARSSPLDAPIANSHERDHRPHLHTRAS